MLTSAAHIGADKPLMCWGESGYRVEAGLHSFVWKLVCEALSQITLISGYKLWGPLSTPDTTAGWLLVQPFTSLKGDAVIWRVALVDCPIVNGPNGFRFWQSFWTCRGQWVLLGHYVGLTSLPWGKHQSLIQFFHLLSCAFGFRRGYNFCR